jgi:tetratricopeptide (TPR) repeat protein
MALSKSKPEQALTLLATAGKLDRKGTFRFGFPPDAATCELQLRLGRLDDAAASCKSALAARKTYTPARVNLVAIALQKGDYQGASKKLEAILETSPSNERARVLLTRAQIMLGSTEKARQNVDTLLSANAPPFDTDMLQGLLQFRQRRHEAAWGWFERAHKADPSAPEVRLYMAWCNLHLGKIEASKKDILAIIDDPVWSGPAHTAAGEYRRRLGDPAKAIANAQTGVDRLKTANHPPERLAEAYTILGVSLEARWTLDHPLVVAALGQAASVESFYAPAMYQWARVAARLGDEKAYANRLKSAVARDRFYCPAVKSLQAWKDKVGDESLEIPDTCTK